MTGRRSALGLRGRTTLEEFAGPPDRTSAFGELVPAEGGRETPGVEPFRLWVNSSGTVAWVPSWERVEWLAVQGVSRGGKEGQECFGWPMRSGFGVRMPPPIVVGSGLAVWPLGGGEEGYLCVCPRIVPPMEDEEDG